MDASYIDVPGSEIESIEQQGDQLILQFSRAYVIQTMTGASQSSRWHQRGRLVFSEVELLADLPQGPLLCDGGDVGENVYTYRDMIPIPLVSSGYAFCDLRFRGGAGPLKLRATGVSLEMEDRPYYIEHIPAV